MLVLELGEKCPILVNSCSAESAFFFFVENIVDPDQLASNEAI